MESTMEDAKRAMEIVERKLMEKDYVGAKKFINNAHNLFPNLDGRWKTMIDVYISASNGGGSEADWYGVLGVDSLADDEAVKKNYKQLALLLHPDKNKCYGAEGAFKLVSEAWCLLSDKVQRASYDQRRKSKETKIEIQKPPNPYKPTKTTKYASADSSKQRKSRTFWTMCRSCKTQGEYLRNSNLNKAIHCPNCRQVFIATEKTPKASNKSTKKVSQKQVKQQWNVQNKAPNESTTNASSSRINSSPSVSFTWNFSSVSSKVKSNCGSAANQKLKRGLEAQETVDAAEKIIKKARTYEEARRAMDIAERKLSENDYNGAKKFINKAQNMYPKLDGLKQVLMMIDVYFFASNRGEEADWYGILGVDPLADDEVGKRTSYDQRRKLKEAKTKIQKQPNQHNPASSGMEKPPNPCKPAPSNGNQNARDNVDPSVGGRSNKLARWNETNKFTQASIFYRESKC
ncbi:DnaJ domain [Arabidopsis suecica]|uniref:DnaJ domain n=1 Tax=Arabidopsis suecica TaxID=45249 RepID=A0A8T1YQM2_ARASU|nr:DnaJ domain [Arabidopsis suecica]